MDFLYLAPIAGCCILCGYFLVYSRKRSALHPVVRELLNQAVDQRSVMQVEFSGRDRVEERFFGPRVKFDEHTSLIDLALRGECAEWAGETVSVNFTITHRGINSYYQYVSRVRGLSRLADGFAILLDTPAEILPNQKRSFVRVAPSSEATFGVGIWVLNPTQERPSDPASLGVAQIRYRQDHARQMSLLNVSATGLCLQLLRTQEDAPAIDLQPGNRVLCLLMLRSQKDGQTLPFWLDCTVANRAERKNEPYSVIGLNFNAWAVPHQGKGMVDWFAVGDNGAVGPLGAWVLRQQLAQKKS